MNMLRTIPTASYPNAHEAENNVIVGPSEIIAEAALATALAELVRSRGEDAALTLLDKMRDRTRAGEFEPFLHVH